MRFTFELTKEEYTIFKKIKENGELLDKCKGLLVIYDEKIEEQEDISHILESLLDKGLLIKDFSLMWYIRYTLSKFGKGVVEDDIGLN